MKKCALLLTACLMLAGCASLPPFTSSPAPKMQESWSKDIIPVAVGEVNGKQVALYEQHVAVNRQATGSKASFWARFWGWFIGLGVLGGALAFFFPTVFFALVLWLLGKYRKMKQAYLDNKTALEETVEGIKDSGVVVKDSPVAKALDDATSEKTKVLVGEIKAKL